MPIRTTISTNLVVSRNCVRSVYTITIPCRNLSQAFRICRRNLPSGYKFKLNTAHMHLIKKCVNSSVLWKVSESLPHANCNGSTCTTSRDHNFETGSVSKCESGNVALLTESKKVVLQRALWVRKTAVSITQRSINAVSTNATIVCHVRGEWSGDNPN